MSDSKGSKRAGAEADDASRKKVRGEEGNGEKYNPYLAHMHQDGGNGYNSDEPSRDSPFAGMTRRHTTAEQHTRVEDLATNPFTQREHTQKYFQILQSRRDLPVHKQRYV